MLQGYLAIIAAMLIWGSVGIFARFAGQEPLVTVTFRVLIGAAAMAAVTARTLGHRLPGASAPQQPVWLILLSGVALAANWLCFFKAVALTTVSNAVLSYYVAPVLVALTAPLLLNERLERKTILATGLAFTGICIMLYQPGQRLSPSDLAGIGYGLAAACFYASVSISGRMLSGVPAARLVLLQCLAAAPVLVAAVAVTAGLGALLVPAPALALLAVVGIVHTALALFLYFIGLRRVKVQHVGVLAYLDPVSAVLFAYLLLGEVPTAAALAGGALVLGGSAVLLQRSVPRRR